jgi:hypothetical protein
MGWDFPLDQFWRMTEHAQLRRVEASPNAGAGDGNRKYRSGAKNLLQSECYGVLNDPPGLTWRMGPLRVSLAGLRSR